MKIDILFFSILLFATSANALDSSILKTDPATGAPLLLRNGVRVTPQQRINQLVAITQRIYNDASIMGESSDDSRVAGILKSIDEADIPKGGKYDTALRDPALRKVRDLEWFLREGRLVRFRQCDFLDGLLKTALKMNLFDRSLPPPEVSLLQRLRGSAKLRVSRKVLIGGSALAVVGAGTAIAISAAHKSEKPDTSVGSQTTPAEDVTGDGGFGAAGAAN